MKKIDTNIILLIDFDSTFVTVESLDILAEIVLRKRKDKDIAVEKIKKITNLGMEGKITFPQSLSRRLKLFSPEQKDLNLLIRKLKKSISLSIKRNKAFFKNNAENIYILSSGFAEYIIPVVKDLGIREDHVLANTFLFDEKGYFLGHDSENVLSAEKGKVKKILEKGFREKLIMIGDGYTDWEVKEAGLAEKFFAFTENVYRENVVQKADIVASSFEEVIKHI